MHGELSTDHRERGAPKKRFNDSLKKSLSTCNIDHNLAAHCVAWSHTIHQAAGQLKTDRRNSLKDRRQEEEGPRRLHHHPQTMHFPADTAHGPVSPVSVWSAMSVPAVHENVVKLHESSFAKPIHDDDERQSVCGFIAQLVEHRTGIAEITGSNPVEILIFFSGFFFPIT